MQNTPNFPVAGTDDLSLGLTNPVARRSFLRYTGAGLAVGGLWLAGCSKDSDPDTNNDGLTDVGTGDLGILNYAYALEQLEAAFYAQVVTTFYTGATAGEKAILTDLRDHEGVHRDFFKAALGTNALPARVPDFSGIDFTQRSTAAGSPKMGVLDAAKAFEDLGWRPTTVPAASSAAPTTSRWPAKLCRLKPATQQPFGNYWLPTPSWPTMWWT